MGGYTKNIAVIKGLKDGFSSDGGPLSGLVKAERYGASLKIEVTLLNFAPLSEGRYVCALSDGVTTLIVENGLYEGAAAGAPETDEGFAALVCYINPSSGVSPVASAVCGNFHGAALGIKAEVERAEMINAAGIGDENDAREKDKKGGRGAKGGEKKDVKEDKKAETETYEDEAIAEVNYYEFAETDEGGGALREDSQKEAGGRKACKDEAALGAFQKDEGAGLYGGEPSGGGKNLNEETVKNGAYEGGYKGPLARGGFYDRVKAEVENLLKNYPAEENLQRTVEGSRWVKVNYGDGKYYVFGVIFGGQTEVPKYICYGVPTEQSRIPPESMRGLASFIPCAPNEKQRGFWVMYQDAATGASLKIECE